MARGNGRIERSNDSDSSGTLSASLSGVQIAHEKPSQYPNRTRRCALWLRRARACVPAFALLATLFAAPPLRAEAPRDAIVERRILVLRADDRERSPLESRVDRVLGQVLGELGFLVNVSPMPFRDAQLALGCTGSIGKCGERVAAALESEQLAVSALEQKPGSDHAELVLYLFTKEVARDGIAQLPVQPVTRVEAEVRALALTVYADAAPQARVAAHRQAAQAPAQPQAKAPALRVDPIIASEPEPLSPMDEPHFSEPKDAHRNHALLAVGWSATTVGAALLVSGLATSLASREASDDYADHKIDDRDDADRALAAYARAERQADAARVLFGTGGGLLLTGAAVLLWERFGAKRTDRKLQITPMPIARGAAVSLSHNFGRRSW